MHLHIQLQMIYQESTALYAMMRVMESMPISKDESFRINYNPKAGIVLEFSR